MKVSVRIIQQLIGRELPAIDELVARINAQLGGVEETIDLGAKYKDAKIVRIVECEKHPDADKLSVCHVDAGSGELVQVVCGAPNARADMWAVWLPPESVVPSTYGTSEEFKLGARELRGVMSNGMLAAGDELAINNDHDGIIEITERDVPAGKTLQPGASFAEMFALDDTTIDIENKMFTHRPDCFGQLGVAREIAGILGQQFESPQWYTKLERSDLESGSGEKLPLTVEYTPNEKVARFMIVPMSGVTVAPSPLWLQCALVAMGGKPINNVVDITNYMMLMTGQPMHAYDYDKLRGQTIGVRMAHEGETAHLLNDKTYELSDDDIVIVDGEGVIGLAGVMGGYDSEVTNETKNIVLECANFDMYTVRKTSMRHGLFTDAVTRFTKGQSPMQNDTVMYEAMRMLGDMAGAVTAGDVADARDTIGETAAPQTIHPDFIRKRLGLPDMKKYYMVQLLGNVEFPLCQDCGWNPEDAEDNNDDLHVNVPWWRTDIEIPEDVVEEIGRLYGYDKLPRELPARSTKPTPQNEHIVTRSAVRRSLVRAGANEVLTYSFVHENVLKRAEQDAAQAFRLSNALSPDLQYYRLSVLPSLLDKVHGNIKTGHDEFVLFEIGKGHNKKYHADDDDGLPSELEFVDMVYASKKPHAGAPYYKMLQYVRQLVTDLGGEMVIKQIDETMDYPVTAPFDQTRSALVETTDGVFIGMVGELKQSVRKAFKLPDYAAAATLDLQGLVKLHHTHKLHYTPLPKFPGTTKDISLTVATNTNYADVYAKAADALANAVDANIRSDITPVTVYQAADDAAHKVITLRVELTDEAKTITEDQAAQYMSAIEKAFAA